MQDTGDVDLLRECLAHLRLGQVSHHDDGVLMAVRHLVQVVEDAWIAVVELNTLREKHRCVAMGVEGEGTVMECLGFGEVLSFLDKPLKQSSSFFPEPFRMPLHA